MQSSGTSKRKRLEPGELEFTNAELNASLAGQHEEIGPIKMRNKEPEAIKNALAEQQEPEAVKEALAE